MAEPPPFPLNAFSSGSTLSVRSLCGALRGSGGFVLSTRLEPDGSAELDVEFTRASTLDLYCVLVAAALELDRASHLRLTSLCQCARDRHAFASPQTHAFTLRIIPQIPRPEDERFGNWLRANRRDSPCRA
jgi:hypothetical protein